MARKLKTMDGNTAAAHVAYAFTDVAAIYPITPSSNMAEYVDAWAAEGRTNIFGQKVRVVEMQSEAGAAGSVHGAALSGALSSTFTASQGLLLMIPNMFKIAGERLPTVFHVSARTIATHALSIFGDHSDVMAVRQTGYAMLASNSPQEVMDLGAVAHLASIAASHPFVHFFDGFRTSHEMQKIEIWDYDALDKMTDKAALAKFRARANVPAHPVLRGSAQNGDIFFQAREASNAHYDNIPAVVEEYMDKVNAELGTDYKLFNYYGAPDADRIVVAMGSVCETAEEVVDYLTAQGEKVGLLKVRLFRPWSAERFIAALPKSVKSVAVLDRTKEPGSIGEPLYLDVVTALRGLDVTIVGGRYGLASKDVGPAAVFAVFENLKSSAPKNNFTVGINDDVTNLSLPMKEAPDTTPKDIISCKFWGIGSDGTVGANKNSIAIIGDNTNKTAQAYFQYDSRKSGGVTISHLRFGDSPIKSTYYVTKADFVACHNPSYIEKFDMAPDVKPGGAFLINCAWDAEELGKHMPAASKKHIAENNVRVYTVDAIKIAHDLGLGNRTNTVLQAAFFKLSNVLPIEDATRLMKEAVQKSFGRRGAEVVAMNNAAIDAGLEKFVEITVPESWKNPPADVPHTALLPTDRPDAEEYVRDVMIPMNLMQGDALPVSAFLATEGGSLIPAGTSAYEKRRVNSEGPAWIPENCIQCNRCSYVCPHSIIRPALMTEDEVKGAPEGFRVLDIRGNDEHKYSITMSVYDCTGCGVCANTCPAKNKAIVMKEIADVEDTQKYFDYVNAYVTEKDVGDKKFEVKGSQFITPLLQFPGACAGCGETPYAKLVTQLYGDRMFIANATGCSSIWGGGAPSTPYTVNKEGKGPAWTNSLFEDTAELGLGMTMAMRQRREWITGKVEALLNHEWMGQDFPPRAALQKWFDVREDGEASKDASKTLVEALEWATTHDEEEIAGFKSAAPEMYEKVWDKENNRCNCDLCVMSREILDNKDLLVKPSVWIFGGDGWAYDIGYGGLDHVIASGENVNILVFDTEVYSNTGGQASKSTPAGAVAQFAAAGKSIKKKDLAQIAMSYGYVYVAQVAMGANYQQTLTAIKEAEAYDGPSIVIAYSSCINHGLRKGMSYSMAEMKDAVDAGYWHLMRYNPALALEGKNPLSIDNGDPNASFHDFIMGEVRYSSLALSFPDRADTLFKQAESDALSRYELLKKQKEMMDN